MLFCCRKLTFTVSETLTLSQKSGGSARQGIGILFSQPFQGKIDQNSISTDHEGRILSVTAEINNTTVQCPNGGTERSKFVENLPSYIKGGITLMIGGDWNCVENPQMDKFGGNPHRGNAGLASLCFLLQTYGLVGVFGKHNPTARFFTWFSPDSPIGVQIDRFYQTHDIFCTSKSSSVQFFPYSDHDSISFKSYIKGSITPPNTPK